VGAFDAPERHAAARFRARSVSTAFRGLDPPPVVTPPVAQRAHACLDAARQAVAIWSTPRQGRGLVADRADPLASLADASSSRSFSATRWCARGSTTRRHRTPWLRAANRYGAKVKWSEVDIETGEVPTWQWGGLITRPTRLVPHHLCLIDVVPGSVCGW